MDSRVNRRTIVATAWSAPVIIAALSAPQAAASTPLAPLSARYAGPTRFTEGDGGSAFAVWITNLGAATIPAGSLTISMQEGPGFTFSGFSGLQGTWDYGPDLPGGLTFIYYMDLLPGTAGNDDDEAQPLLLYLANDTPDNATAIPQATLLITAPDHEPTVIALPVRY